MPNALATVGFLNLIAGNIMGSLETIMIYDPSAFEDAGFLDFMGVLAGWDNRFFRFRINPQSFSQNESKIRQYRKTSRGWTSSYGGENMIQLRFDGTSGWMLPWSVLRDLGFFDDVRFSLAWWNLTRFNEFYQDIDTKGKELHLVFWGNVYVGHLTNFSLSLNADDPHQATYSFGFDVYPDKVISFKEMLPDFILNMLNVAETTATISSQIGRGNRQNKYE